MPQNNFDLFRQNILDFPKQFKETLKLSKDFKIEGRFENILVFGMGGSAWPAEILDTWLNAKQKDYIIAVNRTYDLPVRILPNTLAVFSSYSGNTEEPLAAYLQAKKINLPMAAVTSGGQLKDLCLADKTPFIEIPQGLQPRMAFGYLFTALAKIVSQAIPDSIDDSLLADILCLSETLRPENLENKAEKLIKKIKNKTPIVYSSDQLKVLGYIWKIKFNESAKTPAFCNYFPELNHNEFSIYSESDNKIFKPAVLILKDSSDHTRIKKRMDLTAEYIKSKNIPVEIIELTGQNLLEKIFNSALLADWTCYFLARQYNADPLSVNLQEDFKLKIKK